MTPLDPSQAPDDVSPPRPTRRWVPFILAGVLLSPCIWLGGQFIAFDTWLQDDSLPFESQQWMKTAPDDGTRDAMFDDLLEHHLKPQMTRREVEQLLGKPGPGDSHPCMGGLADNAVDSLCYTLSVGLDPCTLLLGFNAEGRLISSRRDCS